MCTLRLLTNFKIIRHTLVHSYALRISLLVAIRDFKDKSQKNGKKNDLARPPPKHLKAVKPAQLGLISISFS